jgi:antitoxin component YwqK of YwqJK toxin-antitoxin module
MRTILFSLCMSLIMGACQGSKVKTEEKVVPPFSIAGTKQQVVNSFPDGKVKTALYIDSVSSKKIAEVEFHPNGQPKIDKRFVNDTLQGESWCYYQNGSPWSLNTFENGLNHGPYKTWHDNGQLYIQGQFERGLKTGEWFTYFANGSLNTRGFYQDDEKVGVWNSYNIEGTMKREQDFSPLKKD